MSPAVADKKETQKRVTRYLKDLIKKIPNVDDLNLSYEIETESIPNSETGINEYVPTGYKTMTIRWLDK